MKRFAVVRLDCSPRSASFGAGPTATWSSVVGRREATRTSFATVRSPAGFAAMSCRSCSVHYAAA